MNVVMTCEMAPALRAQSKITDHRASQNQRGGRLPDYLERHHVEQRDLAPAGGHHIRVVLRERYARNGLLGLGV